MAPQRAEEVPVKRVAAPGCRLPTRFPPGEILTDVTQRQWRLGQAIGHGGFGDIYLASKSVHKVVGHDARYVIKIEPHNNGPLFVEMNFYIRAAQRHMIEGWCKQQKIKKVNVPSYEGAGSHMFRGQRYRFLVLPRYGMDVTKLFLARGRKLHVKTVYALAVHMLNALEYIHSRGYAHADVKGSNILLNHLEEKDIVEEEPEAYLVDYGLAFRFRTRAGAHKPFAHDERRAHEGTLEFTSRDAHHGTHSRRGDLETLGYNLIQWLCGRLPWEKESGGMSSATSPEAVHSQKEISLSDVPHFMRECFPSDQSPSATLTKYMQYVANLGFETRPDYHFLRSLFSRSAWKYDKSVSSMDSTNPLKKNHKRTNENISYAIPIKRLCIRNAARKPCVPVNCEMRMTRKNQPTNPKDEFSWEEVLASHPDKMAKLHPIEPPLSPPLTPPPSPPPPALPTYAMLQVIQRIKEKQSGTIKARNSSKTMDHELKAKWMTPAMEAVASQLQNRLARLVISSSNKKSKSCCSPRLTRSRAALLNRQPLSGDKVPRKMTNSPTEKVGNIKSRRGVGRPKMT